MHLGADLSRENAGSGDTGVDGFDHCLGHLLGVGAHPTGGEAVVAGGENKTGTFDRRSVSALPARGPGRTPPASRFRRRRGSRSVAIHATSRSELSTYWNKGPNGHREGDATPTIEVDPRLRRAAAADRAGCHGSKELEMTRTGDRSECRFTDRRKPPARLPSQGLWTLIDRSGIRY